MTIARRHRRLAVALVLLAILAGWTMHGRHPADEFSIAVPSPREPQRRAIVASGTLQAVTTVQVGAQISGTVQSLRADYDTIVHAGDVIATLDPALLDAALGEAQASLVRAEAAESQAEADELGFEAEVGDARTIIGRSVEVGQTVSAAVQAPLLFTIAADLKRMQLAVDVDESDVGGVQTGARATFEVEAYPGVQFDGRVSQSDELAQGRPWLT